MKDGKPYANAPLIKDLINDLTGESKADENGKATVAVTADGLNVVGVEVAFLHKIKGNKINTLVHCHSLFLLKNNN